MQGKTQNTEPLEVNKGIQQVQKNKIKENKSPKLLSAFTYVILMEAYLQERIINDVYVPTTVLIFCEERCTQITQTCLRLNTYEKGGKVSSGRF